MRLRTALQCTPLRWSWHALTALWLWMGSAYAAPDKPIEAALVTIAVDLRPLPKTTFQEYKILSLYRKLLVRLTQAGFAVVGPQLASQVRISLQVSPGGLQVQIRGAGKTISRVIAKSQETMLQYHLEILHKSLTAARRLQSRIQLSAAASRPPPPVRRSRTLPPQRKRPTAAIKKRTTPAPVRPNRWHAEIDLGGFFLYRIQATDFLARLGFRWGKEHGLGIYSSLSLSPSVASAITIIEWGLQVGPTWRQPLVSAFSLEFGLLAGFVHHRYYFGQGNTEQGNRWDFLGSLLVMGNWQIARSVGFRLWLSLGLSFQSRIHLVESTTIWERSLVRLEGGGAFYLSF